MPVVRIIQGKTFRPRAVRAKTNGRIEGRWPPCPCNVVVRELRYFFIWPLGLMYLRKLFHGTKERPGKPYTVTVPPGPVNRLFAGLSRTEQRLMRLGVHWPLGSSLLAVLEKPRELSWDETLSGSANIAG
jgi:hypothetical protein